MVSKSDFDNRESMLGLLLAASTVPIAVSGPFLGRVVDAIDKRTCMIMADLGRLILVTGLAYAIHTNKLSMPLLFGLCIPIFALSPLFDAAAEASLSPLSTHPKMLAQWVALESAVPNLAAVLGALFGSWALSVWDVKGAFWFNAATFLISMALVARLPPLKARVEHTGATVVGSLSFFQKNYPGALRLMTLFGIMNFFVAPLFFYLPLLAHDVLRGDGRDLSLLELAFALGNLLLFAYFGIKPHSFRRTRWLRFVLVASSGVFLSLLADAEKLGQMFAILVCWGISTAFVTYLAISSFQRLIPDQFKGRFFALLTSVCTLAIPASFALVGYLSAHFPLREIIYGNALASLLVSVIFLTVPDDRLSQRKAEHLTHQMQRGA